MDYPGDVGKQASNLMFMPMQNFCPGIPFGYLLDWLGRTVSEQILIYMFQIGNKTTKYPNFSQILILQVSAAAFMWIKLFVSWSLGENLYDKLLSFILSWRNMDTSVKT